MTTLKVINKNELNELKDWAREIFKKNSFNMVDVSSKKETFRRALASGKIFVGKEVFAISSVSGDGINNILKEINEEIPKDIIDEYNEGWKPWKV